MSQKEIQKMSWPKRYRGLRVSKDSCRPQKNLFLLTGSIDRRNPISWTMMRVRDPLAERTWDLGSRICISGDYDLR